MAIKFIHLLIKLIIFNIIFIKTLSAEDTKIDFEDGSSYVGGIIDGMMEGKGIFTSSKNTDNQILKYEGDFKNGKFDGKGILVFHNGDLYDGGFSLGLMHGKGILTYKNGSKYEIYFDDTEIDIEIKNEFINTKIKYNSINYV